MNREVLHFVTSTRIGMMCYLMGHLHNEQITGEPHNSPRILKLVPEESRNTVRGVCEQTALDDLNATLKEIETSLVAKFKGRGRGPPTATGCGRSGGKTTVWVGRRDGGKQPKPDAVGGAPEMPPCPTREHPDPRAVLPLKPQGPAVLPTWGSEDLCHRRGQGHRRTDRRMPVHVNTTMVRKAMFRPTSVVIAVFPPEDEYINEHAKCLHLWERLHDPRLVPDLREHDASGALSI